MNQQPAPLYSGSSQFKTGFSARMMSVVWLLNLCAPIVGIVIWWWLKGEEPPKSRQAALATAVSVCIHVCAWILVVLIFAFSPGRYLYHTANLERAVEAYANSVSKSVFAQWAETGEILVTSDCTRGFNFRKYPVRTPEPGVVALISSCTVTKQNDQPFTIVTMTDGKTFSH